MVRILVAVGLLMNVCANSIVLGMASPPSNIQCSPKSRPKSFSQEILEHLLKYSNDKQMIINRIDGESSVNFFTSERQTPLHIAVIRKLRKVVKKLIAAGANLNVTDGDGVTPLHLAVETNNIKIIEMLFYAGADLNVKGKGGFAPLHWAVIKNNIKIVHYLVAAGANLNIQDFMGYTPLHWAIMGNNKEMIACLVDAGACPYVLDCTGRTPLSRARRQTTNDLFSNARLIHTLTSKDFVCNCGFVVA